MRARADLISTAACSLRPTTRPVRVGEPLADLLGVGTTGEADVIACGRLIAFIDENADLVARHLAEQLALPRDSDEQRSCLWYSEPTTSSANDSDWTSRTFSPWAA